jgi:hypothetical protein
VCDALRDLDVRVTALPVTPARVRAAIEGASRPRADRG